MSARLTLALVAALGGGLVADAASADVESELRAELVGRFALTRAALLSECTDHYTDVDVVGGRISGGRGVRFSAGELLHVDNVKIGPLAGLDVNVSLAVPYLLGFTDGPFTLYEERHCRVQLNFEVDREARRDRGRALAAIAAVLDLFDSEGAAKHAGWNRREREPFPADWETTRREYEAWKIHQRNLAVRKKVDDLLAMAAQTIASLPAGDAYLAAFGAGARARDDSWSSCEAMLDASFYVSGSAKKKPNGWSDGEKVAWATRLARELQRCYLEER